MSSLDNERTRAYPSDSMPTPEELEAEIRALRNELRNELRTLRGEVRQLKGLPAEELGPRSEPPPAWQEGPPPYAKAAAEEPAKRAEAEARLSPPPPPGGNPSGAPPVSGPKPWPWLAAGAGPAAPAAPPERAAAAEPSPWFQPLSERFIGERLLQYVGMFILGLGIIFFLVWSATRTGPLARACISAGAGGFLLWLGRFVQARPPYDRLSTVLVGGGWSVLYITSYAVSHFQPVKLIDNPAVAAGLMLAAAAGMIAHAVSSGSRPFRLYAFGLSYLLLGFCREEIVSFDLFLLLLGASAAVAAAAGEADVLIVSLLGFYAHFAPVYLETVNTPQAMRSMAHFARPGGWLAGAYFIVSLLPFVPKARERLFSEGQRPIADAALSLNIALFALVAGTMGRAYFGVPTLWRASMLSAAFVIPAAGYALLLPGRMAATGLAGGIGLAVLAAAIFEMPNPQLKLLAWVCVSAAWVWMGLFLRLPAWRGAGLLLSGLTFGFYFELARAGEESRRAAALSMFVFSATSYFFSRFYRLWLDDAEPWERPAQEYWLYAGSLALTVGLWGALDAAPFLCALVALCAAGEWAAVRFGRVHFWVQVSLLEVFTAGYSFFVDYGSARATLGVHPQLLTGLMVSGLFAWLRFADPMDETLAKGWEPWTREGQRRLLSWLMTAVLAFAVYKVFDGRLRLPFWAFGAVGLLALGRASADAAFKRQGELLALLVVFESVFSYLLAPSALLSALTVPAAGLYWASVGAVLAGLTLCKSVVSPDETDEAAAKAFGLLALAMGAAYLGKELDRVQLTLAWTALGSGFLGAGLLLRWRELRIPGLGLLGLCVGKALLMDTSGLPLPYRVASFMALGAALLASSGLYVRLLAPDEKGSSPAADH